MMEAYDRKLADKSQASTETFVDDRFPDFQRDLRRFSEMRGDGRICTKVFDLNPTGQPTG